MNALSEMPNESTSAGVLDRVARQIHRTDPLHQTNDSNEGTYLTLVQAAVSQNELSWMLLFCYDHRQMGNDVLMSTMTDEHSARSPHIPSTILQSLLHRLSSIVSNRREGITRLTISHSMSQRNARSVYGDFGTCDLGERRHTLSLRESRENFRRSLSSKSFQEQISSHLTIVRHRHMLKCVANDV